MSRKGTIVNWNQDKGFGFIKPLGGSKEVFAHISDFKRKIDAPSIGEDVTYKLSNDSKGRTCAVNINFENEKNHSPNFLFSYIWVIALIIAIGLPIYKHNYPVEVAYIFIAMSFLSVAFYFKDKAAAKRGNWRVNEDTLHIISILGGWPGAIISQDILRHKTVKQSFRTVFWATVIINSGFIAWTFTNNGKHFLYATIFDAKQYFGKVITAVTPILSEFIR